MTWACCFKQTALSGNTLLIYKENSHQILKVSLNRGNVSPNKLLRNIKIWKKSISRTFMLEYFFSSRASLNINKCLPKRQDLEMFIVKRKFSKLLANSSQSMKFLAGTSKPVENPLAYCQVKAMFLWQNPIHKEPNHQRRC